jgi:hypothetical protein
MTEDQLLNLHPGNQWTHHNGNTYMIVAVSNLMSVKPEYESQVTYIGRNGYVWAKPLRNFLVNMTFDHKVEDPNKFVLPDTKVEWVLGLSNV